jgi:hypothetical protein
MGTSEYSKGKGNRRFPGRGGGRGKRKVPEWAAHMRHAVEDPALLGEASAALDFHVRTVEQIYLLDQDFGHAGLAYAADYAPDRLTFTIRVSAANARHAGEIIRQLEQRVRETHPPSAIKSGLEHHRAMASITPEAVPWHLRNHPWEFAVFSEYNGASSSDPLLVRILLFRNREHTLFGLKEWRGPGAPYSPALGKTARHIIVDPDYRQSLLTDDPRARELWEGLGVLPRW